jgi:lipopolysaccharide/colanic/teichoic acid biosynthesis glycosyltransferase
MRVNNPFKRCFDIVCSFAGLCVLFVPFCVIALVVRMTSRGPVFFRQIRVGRRGKYFEIIKIRTMHAGSEKGGSITAAGDERITAAGKFLRRFKLDEYPQLWNVLAGRMSFVGPRPDVPGYADKLEGKARDILELRPGITGPASLYFKNEEELLASVDNPKQYNDTVIWPKKVELNIAYIEKWSFWKDIGYILITIVPMLDKWFKLVEELKS